MEGTAAVQQAAAAAGVVHPGLPAGLPTPCLQKLVRKHLDRRARLHMLRASKGLAGVVLRNAACCTLTLKHPEGSWGRRGSALGLDARKMALRGIMAGASAMTLRVVLQGDNYAPPSPLWSSLPLSQVTHLTLHSVHLSNDILKNLQLQQCSQLQHLKMIEYAWTLGDRMGDWWGVARRMAKEWDTWLPPSLTSVQAVVYACPHASLSMQPFLTENLTAFSTGQLYDELLGMLVSLPRLAHVAAEIVSISKDYSNKQWPWQQLEFLQGCHLSTLEKLPLQHIPQIRMHGMPSHSRGMTAEAISQAVASLAAHPGFQIVPKTLEGLDVPYLRTTREDPSELVQFCLARVETRPCALYLHESYGLTLRTAPTRDYLVRQLQQLQDHVTAVVFYTVDYNTYPSSAGECKELWKPIVAALPKHVTQIVLHMEQMPSVPVAEGLVAAFTGHEPCAAVRVVIQLYESLDEQSERDRDAYEQVVWELHDLAGVYAELVSVYAVK